MRPLPGQDRGLQVTQLRARFDAELVDQDVPRPPERGQRVGPAAAAVQRPHEQQVQVLPQRVLVDQGGELGQDVVAALEPGPDALLDQVQPAFREPGGRAGQCLAVQAA